MRIKRVVWLLICSLLTMIAAPLVHQDYAYASVSIDKSVVEQDFIVKWNYSPLPFHDEYVILQQDPILKASLIRIYGQDINHVIQRLLRDPNIEYIEKNSYGKIQTSSDSKVSGLPYYMEFTGMNSAKELIEVNPDLTIAILDTGVDFNHPDLSPYLLPGINFVNKNKPPQDDHGHGTMVAGVIVQILQNVQILPVKVMGADGRGDAMTVSQGIRYAVDNGADIISISLADFNYSKKMLEEVAYAEEKGVVVIAVTGNGGYQVGYPAAYPTVLAVGAVDENGKPAAYSNRGQEVDVAAPGTKIYTTKLGGGYTTSTGTSMAGPQVVSLAALILSKYPDYTPAQVRDLIRYTSRDVGVAKWNEQTGYGVIDAVLALMLTLPNDIHELNNSSATAAPAPLGKQLHGVIDSAEDKDWFKINVPNPGTLKINWARTGSNRTTNMKITVYDAQLVEVKAFSSRFNGSMDVSVKKGTYFVRIEAIGTLEGTIHYSLTNSFRIYDDAFGNNHSSSRAYSVPLTQNKLVGTLNTDFEEDWFEFNLPLEGTFSFVVSSSTYALDPVVTVIRPNGQRSTFDRTGFSNGNVEQGEFTVTEGRLKIGIRNYYDQATNGEYYFEWKYDPIIVDPNEPNNSMYSATSLGLNELTYGYIGSVVDYDYFKINVTKEGLYQFQGSNFPQGVQPSFHIYNSKFQRIVQLSTSATATGFTHQVWLTPGTYYLRIDAKKSFTDRLYTFQFTSVDVAFRDIANHWAQASINKLAGTGIITGYEDKTFKPNQQITRAEFVHLLVKSLGLKSTSTAAVPFTDVKHNYWARESIQIAYHNGLITGYSDRTFRPNDPITRSEMVSILVRGLKLQPVSGSDKITANARVATQKFKDVKRQDWYAGDLSILVQLNFIQGFEDGTFRPTANTSRAEVATMLERIWYSK